MILLKVYGMILLHTSADCIWNFTVYVSKIGISKKGILFRHVKKMETLSFEISSWNEMITCFVCLKYSVSIHTDLVFVE